MLNHNRSRRNCLRSRCLRQAHHHRNESKAKRLHLPSFMFHPTHAILPPLTPEKKLCRWNQPASPAKPTSLTPALLQHRGFISSIASSAQSHVRCCSTPESRPANMSSILAAVSA